MSQGNSKSEGNERRNSTYLEEGEARDFIHQKFPTLTHQQVLESVKTAGPLKADICKYIKEKYKI